MLAIRMQRTGRKGHAQFRVVVQDSRQTPTSGRVVAHLGSYDPHTKVAAIDKEKAQTYMQNGAQPSNRVALLLEKEGLKLPEWVSVNKAGARSLRNPEKLRRNKPAEPKAEEAAPVAEEPKVETPAVEAEAAEAPAETEAAPVEESKE